MYAIRRGQELSPQRHLNVCTCSECLTFVSPSLMLATDNVPGRLVCDFQDTIIVQNGPSEHLHDFKIR